MKVGDLVTLSAYGNKIKRAGWVQLGDIGIVKKVRTRAYWSGYEIMWNRSSFHGYHGHPSHRGHSYHHEPFLDRKDLKFVK